MSTKRAILVVAVLLVGTACPKKKEETPPETPKPDVVKPEVAKPDVAKPEPVAPSSAGKPLFAWWSRTTAGELVVPESEEQKIDNAKLYTRAFCERSGALEIAFTGRQNGDAEKLDNGMPLDIELSGDEMRGAKFKVTKGTLKEDERICLVVDQAWTADLTFLEQKDTQGDCSADQKKQLKPLLKGLKTCTKQTTSSDLSSYMLESADNSGVALIGPAQKVFVELGDPNGEYGSGVMDLVLTFKRADGSYLAVTCTMSHESITTALNSVGKDALEEIVSTLYYNAAGG
ncbi:MAG: hypothetical protein QM817_27400 [Archangium sp.]